MILVALGSNLPAAGRGTSLETIEAAVAALEDAGLMMVRRSRWFRSAPQPPSGQPDFFNGVVRVESTLAPRTLLDRLHAVEARFGRVRGEINAARTLDLDLLDCGGMVSGAGPILPHPRLHLRNFVLLPLADVAPGWRHPVSRRTVEELIEGLISLGPDGQGAIKALSARA